MGRAHSPQEIPLPLAPDTAQPPSDAATETWWQWVKQTVTSGGPGQCIFAINNACNAGCQFCNFALDVLPRADWHYVPVDDACRAIDVLSKLFIRYLIISGGEPTLHPGLEAIVRYARRKHMTVVLVSNGSRLTPQRCRQLVAAGVTSLVISVDAASAAVHEQNRRLPQVCDRIRAANAQLTALGVQTTASVTISHLVTDYDALAEFLRQLGFRTVTFSYPLTKLPSSYLGYRSAPIVEFTADELDDHFESIKRLKRSFPVVNPAAAIDEMQRYVRGEVQRFECLGGYRYFYLDWNLMVWRCHSWAEPMCSIFELDESRYVRDGCTKCMVDCYRDASVMQHVAVSITDGVREMQAGHPLRGLSRLASWRNVVSVAAAFETQRWIRGL